MLVHSGRCRCAILLCSTNTRRSDEEFSAPLNTALLNWTLAAKKAALHLYKRCFFSQPRSPLKKKKKNAITLVTKSRRHRSFGQRNPASSLLSRLQQTAPGLWLCRSVWTHVLIRAAVSSTGSTSWPFLMATRSSLLHTLGLTSATLSGTPSPRTSLKKHCWVM